jgi:hypothetical protein
LITFAHFSVSAAISFWTSAARMSIPKASGNRCGPARGKQSERRRGPCRRPEKSRASRRGFKWPILGRGKLSPGPTLFHSHELSIADSRAEPRLFAICKCLVRISTIRACHRARMFAICKYQMRIPTSECVRCDRAATARADSTSARATCRGGVSNPSLREPPSCGREALTINPAWPRKT